MPRTTLELDDGRAFIEYDSLSGEILDAYDWHGCELPERIIMRAEDIIRDRLSDAAEARLSDR